MAENTHFGQKTPSVGKFCSVAKLLISVISSSGSINEDPASNSFCYCADIKDL